VRGYFEIVPVLDLVIDFSADFEDEEEEDGELNKGRTGKFCASAKSLVHFGNVLVARDGH
jgi:hypothetical protein